MAAVILNAVRALNGDDVAKEVSYRIGDCADI